MGSSRLPVDALRDCPKILFTVPLPVSFMDFANNQCSTSITFFEISTCHLLSLPCLLIIAFDFKLAVIPNHILFYSSVGHFLHFMPKLWMPQLFHLCLPYYFQFLNPTDTFVLVCQLITTPAQTNYQFPLILFSGNLDIAGENYRTMRIHFNINICLLI